MPNTFSPHDGEITSEKMFSFGVRLKLRVAWSIRPLVLVGTDTHLKVVRLLFVVASHENDRLVYCLPSCQCNMCLKKDGEIPVFKNRECVPVICRFNVGYTVSIYHFIWTKEYCTIYQPDILKRDLRIEEDTYAYIPEVPLHYMADNCSQFASDTQRTYVKYTPTVGHFLN